MTTSQTYFYNLLLVLAEKNKYNLKEVYGDLDKELPKELRRLPEYMWFKTYYRDANWEDNIGDIVERALNMKSAPQQWNGDIRTPLDIKLRDTRFKDYYDYYCKKVASAQKLVDKGITLTTQLSISNSSIVVHEKLYVALVLDKKYRRLNFSSAVSMLMRSEDKKSMYYTWFDCCGRIKYQEKMENLLLDIGNAYGFSYNGEELLTKHEKLYSSALEMQKIRNARF